MCVPAYPGVGLPRQIIVWLDHGLAVGTNSFYCFRLVRGSLNMRVQPDRDFGWTRTLIVWLGHPSEWQSLISFVFGWWGPPSLIMLVQARPSFGLTRQVIVWLDHARDMGFNGFDGWRGGDAIIRA